MASALVANGTNAALNALVALGVFVSAHTALPSSAGSNEVTGGTPAYARKAVTWGAAASGSVATSNSPVIDIPAGTTVAYIGLWSLATGGVFYGYWDVTDEVFGGQGTYTFNSGSTIAIS